ncbi:MAG: DUF3987 domain-containing protein [Bacteroidales bacterium]|jgi:hypothetical protein|nr:DUF3987 domain-containing protein [Bacteroidales bacterium]
MKKHQHFPLENMPSLIKNFAKDIADVYGVPIEYPTMCIISAFGTALGNKVRLKTEKYINYPQLWIMIVGPSGVGKSEPLKIAYEPIWDFEKKESDLFKKRLNDWESACIEAKSSGLAQPEKPKQKRILCNDTTPEVLFSLLAENRTLTICRDELEGHFQDIGRYNKSGEVAHHLSCFNNVSFSIDRKSEENSTMISKPILSIIGTIQPKVLQKVASQNSMRENGYLQRCLFVYPGNVLRPYHNENSLNPDYVLAYQKMIDYFFVFPENTDFSLSSEAKEMFVSFANEISEAVNSTDDEYLRSLYSKMEIHALRLALILAVIDDKMDLVSEVAMRYAIDLCRYFIATGEKIHQPQEKNWTNNEIYCLVDEEIGIKNVSKFAESVGVKRQNVEKALKNSKVERVLATDDNAVFRAFIKRFDRQHANIQLSRLQDAEGTDCIKAHCNSENHCDSNNT